MEEEVIEVINIEHLKTLLSHLSPRDIVEPAYKEWIPCQRTGHTIIDLESGTIQGLGVELNQLPLASIIYITLYTIKSGEHPITPEELFSEEEYECYMNFKDDDPSEYTPDIVSNFCEAYDINENERKISILADRFEEDKYWNYNMWESGVLEDYYDALQGDSDL